MNCLVKFDDVIGYKRIFNLSYILKIIQIIQDDVVFNDFAHRYHAGRFESQVKLNYL